MAKKKVETKQAAPEKKEEVKETKPVVTLATAFARDVRVTPRKIRYVADAIRGKDVEEALALLKRTNKSASTPLYKLVLSAKSNAVNNFGLAEDKLYIAEIQASDGKRMKRFTPRAKGSASPVVKRMSNIRIVVKERQ
jgi:large subunit ribosomal protein L22